MKECSSCGKITKIVNSHFKLCQICNKARLSSNESFKEERVHKSIDINRSALGAKKRDLKQSSKKTLFIQKNKGIVSLKNNLLKDEIFYEECFNLSNHSCEECNKDLPDTFRTDDSKVNARWRYSHIIPKSIAPELRHDVNNINHLCLKCHGIWEHGDKTQMKIFPENLAKFPGYLNRLVSN